MLMQVGKFYVSVNFIVLEMKENAHIPLIFRRPFLAINIMIIDVKSGKLILKIRKRRLSSMFFI